MCSPIIIGLVFKFSQAQVQSVTKREHFQTTKHGAPPSPSLARKNWHVGGEKSLATDVSERKKGRNKRPMGPRVARKSKRAKKRQQLRSEKSKQIRFSFLHDRIILRPVLVLKTEQQRANKSFGSASKVEDKAPVD